MAGHYAYPPEELARRPPPPPPLPPPAPSTPPPDAAAQPPAGTGAGPEAPPAPSPDHVTRELERLVEETHQHLVSDGLIPADSCSDNSVMFGPLPSLDAVDQALEELRRGLEEIDSALAEGA